MYNITNVTVGQHRNNIGHPGNMYTWSHECSQMDRCQVTYVIKRLKTFVLDEECSICYEIKTPGHRMCLRCQGSCCDRCWLSVTTCPLCRCVTRLRINFKRKSDDMTRAMTEEPPPDLNPTPSNSNPTP